MDKNCITLHLTSRQANLLMDALKAEGDHCYIAGLDHVSDEYYAMSRLVSDAWDVFERHEQGEPTTAELIADHEWSRSDRFHQMAQERGE